MRELHLFAGAGGGILGGLLLGHRPVCAVEIEEYPRKVLLQRQRDGILPRFPIWDDVTTFDGKPWRGKVDVVCGGFPCQDISAAGKGAGIEGERSGLWGEMARIISQVSPRFVFIENSPLLISRGLGTVLCDLSGLGYDARWGVIGARHIGGCHKRDRIWIFAYTKGIGLRGRCSKECDELHRIMVKGEQEGCPFWSEAARRSMGDFWLREITSEDSRNGNGVAGWVDRLKAIGNGQVPAVAATAWRILHGE